MPFRAAYRLISAGQNSGHASRRLVALVLDVLITTYLLVLAIIVATGGFDFGFVSVNGAAKPILILLIALPLRVALGGRFRLWDATQRAIALQSKGLRSLAPGWITGAMDVTFAVAIPSLATLSVGFIANLLLSTSRVRPFQMPFETALFAEIFAAWDSGWYFDIARRGYYFEPHSQSSIAFFPLYPMLMRAIAWPFGSSDRALWMAGIAVSYTAFWFALLALHRFTERTFGDRETARRTVLYLALFPFALFFTRVYAESVFLLTSVVAVSGAHEGRWARAGVWGALATLARPNGILIGLPLALLTIRDRPEARELGRRLMFLALVPAALAGYCVYVWGLSGDPLGWLSSQGQWGYSLGHPPWQQLLKMLERLVRHGVYDYFFVSSMAPFRLFHGVAALIFLGLTPAIFKRLGVPLGAYVLVSLLVPLSGNALEGIGRYAAVLFPAFMVVGSIKSTRTHEAILITGSVLLALFVCLFVTSRPIY